MQRKTSGGTTGHHKDPPVEQYRKEIGKHQEVIENPNSIKKRTEHKEKVRGEHTPETPQDLPTSISKIVQMVVIWALLIGSAYLLIQYLMKPGEHPFSGGN